jgi:hypothetical protein
MLEFKDPLIVDGQRARALFRRHRTNASDHKLASAGAWALRDEVMAEGHDAIIAVEGTGAERHLTIVHFDTESAMRGTVISFPERGRERTKTGVAAQTALAAAS